MPLSEARPRGELQSSLKILIATGSRPSIPTVNLLLGSFGHTSRGDDLMGPLPEACGGDSGVAAPSLPPPEEEEEEEGEEAASPSRLWNRGIRWCRCRRCCC